MKYFRLHIFLVTIAILIGNMVVAQQNTAENSYETYSKTLKKNDNPDVIPYLFRSGKMSAHFEIGLTMIQGPGYYNAKDSTIYNDHTTPTSLGVLVNIDFLYWQWKRLSYGIHFSTVQNYDNIVSPNYDFFGNYYKTYAVNFSRFYTFLGPKMALNLLDENQPIQITAGVSIGALHYANFGRNSIQNYSSRTLASNGELKLLLNFTDQFSMSLSANYYTSELRSYYIKDNNKRLKHNLNPADYHQINRLDIAFGGMLKF